MATLHVRNIPGELHERIKRLAAGQNRSLSAEVVDLLDLAVRQRELRAGQRRLLSRIRSRRYRPPAGTPDSVDLIREDRTR